MENTDFDELEEMILNESFREFAEGTNPESVELWNEWISANPEKRAVVEKAVGILKVLVKAGKAEVRGDKRKSLDSLMKLINKEQPENISPVRKLNSVWLKIAAVSLLVIGLSSVWKVFTGNKNRTEQIAYNEIIAPLGEKAQVVLSDGSHVWINSDSKLRYPVKFGETSRDVSLEGEAYFDVARQHGKMFVVNTRDVKINVLGTAFNVKC